jgi:kinesin family protein 2/24
MLDLIKAASSYRQTQSTEKNDASSRSHAICRIRIHNDSTTDEEDGVLYLIDLAGSEAARDTANHTPQRMREAREINTSLSVLKDCIRGKAEADAMSLTGPMSSKKGAYVPFRQSPLTKLLKHIFDPATVRPCKTVVVACVNPCILDAGPSRNTLQYAETLRVIIPKNEKVQPSPDAPKTWDNAELKAWIRENVRLAQPSTL